jgi:hypothetical protein|nr:MAG TPA: hypothetical protein [Caudoviricetes sp.]
MIAYRIQDKDRNVADLTVAENQWSYPMGGADDEVRRGVSGCRTLAELAAYVATSGIDAGSPVLVKIEGPKSPDRPVDATLGEVLILPETAEIIDDDEEFFEVVGELVDIFYSGSDFDDVLEAAEDRI